MSFSLLSLAAPFFGIDVKAFEAAEAKATAFTKDPEGMITKALALYYFVTTSAEELKAEQTQNLKVTDASPENKSAPLADTVVKEVELTK